MKKVSFDINPLIIASCLSEEQRKRNIILLDIDFDIDDNGANRIDLDVVFNPISVKIGMIQRVDYYIGSSGAEILIDLSDGDILEYTQAAKFDEKFESRATASNTYNSRFTRFACRARDLNPILRGKSIKWMLTLPRDENIVRDFLIGNLYLFVTCTWQNNKKSGYIHIRPSDIRFFDSDYKPIEKHASMLMQLILWREGVKLENCDGFSISFEEKDHEINQ